jgi:pimeloyl-ACP methyl ester carboxylesterase
MEFRRLFPLLAKHRQIYAPDMLGWGFTECGNVQDFSPTAKLAHLKAFLEQVVKTECILVGASLGGGVAINLAVDMCSDLVKAVILVDAQVRCITQCKNQAPSQDLGF